jgi:hypothetical protein
LRNKIVLKVKRFSQRGNECAVAACSSFANFFDQTIQYKVVRKDILDIATTVNKDGMTTPEQGLLLNKMGFSNIKIVTAYTDLFDFTWEKKTKEEKIERLKKIRSFYKRKSNLSLADLAEEYLKFLNNDGCDNTVIIDYDFSKWIKSIISKGKPVIASINYTAFNRLSKTYNEEYDDIKGDPVEHALAIRGFDKDSIYVVDSSGKRTKKYTGYYKIKWEHFLVNIGTGDLIFAE